MILDELFRFPVIMVDGDNEESKKTLYSGGRDKIVLDTIEGEAEYPYFAFIGISDRWLPNQQSFSKALDDEQFDACMVTFANIGSFLVPWTKEEFKKKFRKFVEGIPKLPPAPQQTIQLIQLTEEDITKTDE